MLSREECARIAKVSKPSSDDGETFICEWHNPPDVKIKLKKSICLVDKNTGNAIFVCKNCMNSKLNFSSRAH